MAFSWTLECSGDAARRSPRLVSTRGPPLVRDLVRPSDRGPGEGVAADCLGTLDAAPRADRVGENATGISPRDRPAHVFAGASEERAVPDPVRLAVEGSRGRRRAKPPGA